MPNEQQILITKALEDLRKGKGKSQAFNDLCYKIFLSAKEKEQAFGQDVEVGDFFANYLDKEFRKAFAHLNLQGKNYKNVFNAIASWNHNLKPKDDSADAFDEYTQKAINFGQIQNVLISLTLPGLLKDQNLQVYQEAYKQVLEKEINQLNLKANELDKVTTDDLNPMAYTTLGHEFELTAKQTGQANTKRSSNLIKQLVENLNKETKTYFAKPLKEQDDCRTQFQEVCLNHINAVKPELEQHRGLKKILGNLTLAVLGLGIGYVIAASINKAVTGNFLFFNDTASAKKLNDLEAIVKLKPFKK